MIIKRYLSQRVTDQRLIGDWWVTWWVCEVEYAGGTTAIIREVTQARA